MSFLVLRSVAKRYGAATALDGIDLDVAEGSRTAIVGPSGSGKTTLLRIVAGFEAPDQGQVTLGGERLADGPAAMPAHRRGVGVVAQDGALFPHLTVAENVGFGLDRREPRRADRIAELMHLVGLETAMLPRRPDELSGGQQQRVALARALARRPRLMLLDEPFSALDTALRANTRKAVGELLRTAGITTVLVTHDQAEALSFADQVAIIRGGRLLQTGTPREVYTRPADREVAEFLGDAVILPGELAGGVVRCALGRLAAHDGARPGRVTIMLRPEQIVLHPGDAPGPGACRVRSAEITEIDFNGAVCVCGLRLLSGPRSEEEPHDVTLPLRVSSSDVLVVGAVVRLELTGRAHVLSA
jgi:iron(III) transport system ATP-binding protein